MSVSLPNGVLLALATAYAAPQTISAISNASPGVATCTAHGYANGDILEITSGWSRLNNKLVRAASVAANTFQLEGIDTSSTSLYPAGSGIGTVRKVTTFTQIS